MNKYVRYTKVPIDEVFFKTVEARNEKKAFIEVEGFHLKINSKRMRSFFGNELKCRCGIRPLFYAIERDYGNLDSETPYLNLYGIDHYGKEVLFTIDHKIPRSKGGANTQENLEPMCSPCNAKKGDTL